MRITPDNLSPTLATDRHHGEHGHVCSFWGLAVSWPGHRSLYRMCKSLAGENLVRSEGGHFAPDWFRVVAISSRARRAQRLPIRSSIQRQTHSCHFRQAAVPGPGIRHQCSFHYTSCESMFPQGFYALARNPRGVIGKESGKTYGSFSYNGSIYRIVSLRGQGVYTARSGVSASCKPRTRAVTCRP